MTESWLSKTTQPWFYVCSISLVTMYHFQFPLPPLFTYRDFRLFIINSFCLWYPALDCMLCKCNFSRTTAVIILNPCGSLYFCLSNVDALAPFHSIVGRTPCPNLVNPNCSSWHCRHIHAGWNLPQRSIALMSRWKTSIRLNRDDGVAQNGLDLSTFYSRANSFEVLSSCFVTYENCDLWIVG